MAAEKERNGMYQSSFKYMLKELEVLKMKYPDNYKVAAELLEYTR